MSWVPWTLPGGLAKTTIHIYLYIYMYVFYIDIIYCKRFNTSHCVDCVVVFSSNCTFCTQILYPIWSLDYVWWCSLLFFSPCMLVKCGWRGFAMDSQTWVKLIETCARSPRHYGNLWPAAPDGGLYGRQETRQIVKLSPIACHRFSTQCLKNENVQILVRCKTQMVAS